MKPRLLYFLVCATAIGSMGILRAESLSPLASRGYSVLPAPRQVELRDGDLIVDDGWRIVSEAGEKDIAFVRLRDGAADLHGLEFASGGSGIIELKIDPRSVTEKFSKGCSEQAYRIEIGPNKVTIAGNEGPGLLYGVQTFLQLLKPAAAGGWSLPVCTITDWPELPLRFIHWDTKHHQNRIETLKRYIDWASFFKASAIGFEMEDKYEYPTHPVIGVPGAYTREQMHDLTRYALERHIQLVPQIQSPAHMAYVLKHEQFARFRADGSNYQVCLCDDEAVQLIFDIYADMIEATPGVKYFHASTDEVYFAGICDKCSKPYNDENRSLAWVEFVNRAYRWLEKRNRKMLCWVEYPLLQEHIGLLPRGLINGVTHARRGGGWNDALARQGIDQLIYTSQQGSELLVPNFLPSKSEYRGSRIEGKIGEPVQTIRTVLKRGVNAIGTYAAAWDDSGLHDELFWIGWATVTQYGWSPESPPVEQSTADFMELYYGPGNFDMIEAYRTLMDGARFYENALDRVPATRLKPSYGSWARKGRDTTRIDLTLEPPQLPFSYDMTLVVEDNFSRKYAGQLKAAPEMLIRLDKLIHLLNGKLNSVRRNRYNIEVLLSVARFEKHFCRMLLDLQDVEKILLDASKTLKEGREREVVSLMTQAHAKVNGILEDRNTMWTDLKRTWEKSRFEKGRSVDGRQFIHVLDDLKDHRADRRQGLDYMLEPLENIGLESWNERFAEFIRSFASGTDFEPPEFE